MEAQRLLGVFQTFASLNEAQAPLLYSIAKAPFTVVPKPNQVTVVKWAFAQH